MTAPNPFAALCAADQVATLHDALTRALALVDEMQRHYGTGVPIIDADIRAAELRTVLQQHPQAGNHLAIVLAELRRARSRIREVEDADYALHDLIADMATSNCDLTERLDKLTNGAPAP